MKKEKFIVLSIICLISLNSCKLNQKDLDGILTFESVDPLEKIFLETEVFITKKADAAVARGEHATFQFALRCSKPIKKLKVSIKEVSNGTEQLTGWSIGYIGYVGVGRNTPVPSRDKLYSISGLYPDPIFTKPPAKLERNHTQPIWITIPVPLETKPGKYIGELVVKGRINRRRIGLKEKFSVQVFPPQIAKTSLWITNWYSISPEQLSRMNNGIIPGYFSDEYWSLVRILARKMAEYRQNVALISPLQLTEYSHYDSIYRFDFSNFDRMVKIFIDEGVIGRIEGGHIGSRDSTWTTPFVVYVPVIEKDTTIFEKFAITNDTAINFYRQFIPELDTHLIENGWSDIYMQHIADEPIPENIDSYVEISRFIKKLAPNFRIIEACHTRDLEDMVDIWVPQLDFLHIDFDFYKEKQEEGDAVWYYTCLAPQGNYANRFIELPLIETRILHWINFRYGLDGYLHWGLNHWRSNPFNETTDIITESGNVLPGGDAWIVYPSDHEVLSSIRFEAMRDGIVDYELLKMLEEKYPEQAKEIARQIVYQFDRYDINIDQFRIKRREILEMLSE